MYKLGVDPVQSSIYVNKLCEEVFPSFITILLLWEYLLNFTDVIFTIGSCDLGTYIEIYNLPSSNFIICEVYISTPGEMDWETELLNGDVILPGFSHSFKINPGICDVRVREFNMGWVYTRTDVSVAPGSTTTLEFDGSNLN